MPTDLPPWVLAEREAVGRRIRARRESLGITQERLAEGSGLNRHTIYRTELGTHAATIDVLVLIADALAIEPARLFEERGEER